MAETTNPWSAFDWDPVAQASYLRSKGLKRATIRAREAGTTPHGPRPENAMLRAAKIDRHRNIVRGLVRHKNATRGIFIQCHMDLGFNTGLEARVEGIELDFGFNMSVLLEQEIDIILNPGEFSFSARFDLGFDESFRGFGAQLQLDPIVFRLGTSMPELPFIERQKSLGPFAFALGLSETASTGNERIMLPINFGIGFNQSPSTLTNFAFPAHFDLGLDAAASVERYASLATAFSFGFVEAAAVERAREIVASMALGFKVEDFELGDFAFIKAKLDLGFSIEQSIDQTQFLAAAFGFGLDEHAASTLERDLTASMSMGFNQSAPQPYLPLEAHFDMGFATTLFDDLTAFFNIISRHSLGFDTTVAGYIQPTEFLEANPLFGFGMTATLAKLNNVISSHDLGFDAEVFLTYDRDLPTDTQMGFNMAAAVVMPFDLTVNMALGFNEQADPYIPFPLDPIDFDLGFDISKADIPKFSPLIIQATNFYNQTTSSTTITFSGCSFGPSLTQPKAIVVTATHGNNNQTLLAMDIGGATGTLVAGQSISNTRHSETWSTVVDGSVTSGNIVLHLSGAEAGASIVVDVLTGTPSGITDFREVAVSSGANYPSQTLAVKAGGYFIGIAPHSNNVNVVWAAGNVSLDNVMTMNGYFTNSGLYQARNQDGDVFTVDGTFTTGQMTATGTQQPYVYMLVLEPGPAPTYVKAAMDDFGFDMVATFTTTVETVFSASNDFGFGMSTFLTGALSPSPALGFGMAATLTTVPVNVMTTTFIGSQSSVTGTSFTGFNIGSPDANGWVVVFLYYGSSGIRLPTAVTIGGVAATRAVRSASITARCVDIWYAKVTSGGTINITATYGGNSNNAAVGVYMMSGPLDTASIQTHSVGGAGPYQPVFTLGNQGNAGFAGSCTSSGNVTTFSEPTAADFAANHATATTYRYAGGHSGPINSANWLVNITAAGSLNWISALFPPL